MPKKRGYLRQGANLHEADFTIGISTKDLSFQMSQFCDCRLVVGDHDCNGIANPIELQSSLRKRQGFSMRKCEVNIEAYFGYAPGPDLIRDCMQDRKTFQSFAAPKSSLGMARERNYK